MFCYQAPRAVQGRVPRGGAVGGAGDVCGPLPLFAGSHDSPTMSVIVAMVYFIGLCPVTLGSVNTHS